MNFYVTLFCVFACLKISTQLQNLPKNRGFFLRPFVFA
ncbi:hypothetical protein HFN_0850 [Helicobacter fennelliae MRY12-0050]|uniref:Uncharacterized protein n=1 Tax=Helicobacter fennelliae MRY12-0050 TaxID=1325130 RepID=T1D0A3_9HELI|nr:hypothetical protein HFN_0850 [Helicobacter fennelliae MRY12-0050]